MYGVVSYDIAKVYEDGEEVPRQAQTKVPNGLLKLGWLRGAKSTYCGDLSQRDKVMDLLGRYLTNERDVIFPVLRVEKDSEKEIRQWVRVSTRLFFEEVVGGVRERVDKLMKQLDDGKVGIGDVGEKLDDRVKRVEKKIEDIMVALASFRLSEEFKDFREAVLKEMEVVKDDCFARLVKKAAEVHGEDEKKEEVA